MKSKQLQSLILQGECDCVEFKEKPCDRMYRTICAFLNTRGGILLVGISDDGRVVGYRPSHTDQMVFQAKVLKWNSLFLKEEIVRIGLRSLWQITVKSLPTSNPSHPMATWNGDAYIRLGSSTQKVKSCLHVRIPI